MAGRFAVRSSLNCHVRRYPCNVCPPVPEHFFLNRLCIDYLYHASLNIYLLLSSYYLSINQNMSQVVDRVDSRSIVYIVAVVI